MALVRYSGPFTRRKSGLALLGSSSLIHSSELLASSHHFLPAASSLHYALGSAVEILLLICPDIIDIWLGRASEALRLPGSSLPIGLLFGACIGAIDCTTLLHLLPLLLLFTITIAAIWSI